MKNFFLIGLIISTAIFVMSMKPKSVRDLVPDEATAIRIAEAIWLPIYGENVYTKRPFIVKLENEKIWVVSGTSQYQKGGVPYIEIQKSDCKILKVTHTK